MDEPRKGEEKKRSTTAKKRPEQSKLKCAKKSANGFYFTSKRQKRKLAVGFAAEEKVKNNIKDSDDNVDDEDDVTKISVKHERTKCVFIWFCDASEYGSCSIVDFFHCFWIH